MRPVTPAPLNCLAVILWIALLIFCAAMVGCAPSRTLVTWHDGRVIRIDSQDRSQVTVKIDGDGEVAVDNRKPSMVRDFIQLMLLKVSQEPIRK